MKTTRNNKTSAGMTAVEVIIVVLIVFLVELVLLAAVSFPSPRARAGRINCVSNLKGIGLSFRMWSQEHGDKFPWAVSTNEGGTMELAESPTVFQHFAAISNELASPKVLVCNSDAKKSKVSNWSDLSDSHLSYFVGLEANEAFPQSILSGDRNLTTNGKSAWGVVNFASNTVAGFGPDMHKHAGNIGLGDGSSMQVTDSILRKRIQAALQSTNMAALRLSIPKPN